MTPWRDAERAAARARLRADGAWQLFGMVLLLALIAAIVLF